MFEKSNNGFEQKDPGSPLSRLLSRAAVRLTQLFGDGDELSLLFKRHSSKNVVLEMVAESTEHHGNRLIEWVQFAADKRVPSFADEYRPEVFEFAASPEGREVLDSWLRTLGEDFTVEKISTYIGDTKYVCHHEAIDPDDADSALSAVETFKDAESALTDVLIDKGA